MIDPTVPAPRITPVILCGGSGTRLWPRSRAVKPKPFIPLVGDSTLFRATIDRAGDAALFDAPIIVTGQAHSGLCEEQLLPGERATIIVEPSARNTAAAIALAACHLPADAIMLVCPSDHHIGDNGAFRIAAAAAATLAAEGWLVSFGIEATAPETGFGYLLRGDAINDHGHRVERFVEKPDRATAEAFLADGRYAWNGGIFAFRAGSFLDELARHRPAIAEAVRQSVAQGRSDGARFYPEPAAFDAVISESVDYAVMENTDRAAMVAANMAWSDIGNWQALHAAQAVDALGNHVRGDAELVDCRNVMVMSDGPHVSAIGLDNVIIVVDGNNVLVTTADGVQLVGKLSGATNQ